MSDKQLDNLSRWLPLAITILFNAVMLGVTYGRLDQRITPLESHVALDTTENAMKIFVTKSEFIMSNDTRNRELTDLKNEVSAMNLKLDRLLERTKP